MSNHKEDVSNADVFEHGTLEGALIKMHQVGITVILKTLTREYSPYIYDVSYSHNARQIMAARYRDLRSLWETDAPYLIKRASEGAF